MSLVELEELETRLDNEIKVKESDYNLKPTKQAFQALLDLYDLHHVVRTTLALEKLLQASADMLLADNLVQAQVAQLRDFEDSPVGSSAINTLDTFGKLRALQPRLDVRVN